MIITERNGKLTREYTENADGKISRVKKKNHNSDNILLLFYSFFQDVFLPQGFPESVSSDYVTYQLWDTLQAFCSSLTGALAMKAVLDGYGVGDESKTVLAAAITWLLRDGTSMCGRIAFTWLNGSRLDSDCKQWRLFADVLNDIAMFLELISQYFPAQLFLPIVCLSGLFKSVVGVAGGATRAALTQHQAKRNNMADVSAKDGSQETLVNLAALLANLWLLGAVDGKHRLIWTLFVGFTLLHVYSNFRAVSSVVMETLNLTRFFLVVTRFVENGRVTSPRLANQSESVWRRNHNPTNSSVAIRFATSVGKMIDANRSGVPFKSLDKLFGGSRFLVWFSVEQNCVDVLLHENCGCDDELQALYFASILRLELDNPTSFNLHSGFDSLSRGNENQVLQYLEVIQSYVSRTFDDFHKSLLQAGWDTRNSQFDSKCFRFSLSSDLEQSHLD